MSCFMGQMLNYTFLSIDRFDGENLGSSAFFLSHCHTDHMVGLTHEAFKYKLKCQPDVKLFTSEVTKCLLLADERYSFLLPNIEVLLIEDPKLLSIKTKSIVEELTVTLLPAGHCPGSVMFLFEGAEGTMLYTGDFRLSHSSASRMPCLKNVIDHIYVDTTFCIEEAWYIPPRELCVKNLLKIVQQWIVKGNQYVVRLNMSAKYGYEYLIEELHKSFGEKIYCSRAKNYDCLPNIASILTTDPTCSHIFVCYKTEILGSQWKASKMDVADMFKNFQWLTINLSTMYFTNCEEAHVVEVQTNKQCYRLCFSFHSSLSEICSFLRQIKPTHIHANVLPSLNETLYSVEERLRHFCTNQSHSMQQSYRPLGSIQSSNNQCVEVVQRSNSLDLLHSNKVFSFARRKRKTNLDFLSPNP
ncbi:protein artemis isoform X2 [Ciona intestinalis]